MPKMSPQVKETITDLKCIMQLFAKRASLQPEADIIAAQLRLILLTEDNVKQSDIIGKLRRKALPLLEQDKSSVISVSFRGHVFTFAEVIYCILKELARFAPLNTKDPASDEVPPEKYQFFTATGHLFDIRSLVDGVNARRETVREAVMNDPAVVEQMNQIMNPFLATPFNRDDVADFNDFAAKNKLVIVAKQTVQRRMHYNMPPTPGMMIVELLVVGLALLAFCHKMTHNNNTQTSLAPVSPDGVVNSTVIFNTSMVALESMAALQVELPRELSASVKAEIIETHQCASSPVTLWNQRYPQDNPSDVPDDPANDSPSRKSKQ